MLLLTIYETNPKGSDMIKRISSILLVSVCFVLCGIFFFTAGAAEEEPYDGLMFIAHGGDTAEFDSNTAQAVVSAFNKGADFVSINIRKNAAGELVLCDRNKAKAEGDSLADVLGLIGEDDILILDFESAIKDEIYAFVKANGALSSVMLRINDSAENINDWLNGKDENLQVVGVYDGFVVFTAVQYIKTLSQSGMTLVQYQSKNYFNEMFGSFVSKTIFSSDAKAVAATYDPDLCGQRRDSDDGWNELIKLGFSVIETNNTDAFAAYKKSNKSARNSLEKIYLKAKSIDAEEYNTVSRENLADAIAITEDLLARSFASSDEFQSAASYLTLAIENLALKTGEDTQKGALNITFGKVIAAVLVGTAMLAAQVYTYKMQKNKKK